MGSFILVTVQVNFQIYLNKITQDLNLNLSRSNNNNNNNNNNSGFNFTEKES